MSSAQRCNSEVGSLNDTGSVIFVMSFPIIDLRILYKNVSNCKKLVICICIPIRISLDDRRRPSLIVF